MLCRDMYYKKVPMAYKFVYFPKRTPYEQLFINMVRNMDSTTHKYKGGVPYTLTEVRWQLSNIWKPVDV